MLPSRRFLPVTRASSADGNNTTSSGRSDPPVSVPPNTSRAVWLGRALFILCLSAVAVGLGVGTHRLLTDAETDLANQQFASIAERALKGALDIANRKLNAATALSTTIGHMHPNASDWPFVTVPGFEQISQEMLDISSGGDMGFFPLVSPEQRVAFEAFAYDFYETVGYPSGAGKSVFGRGMYRFDFTPGVAQDGRIRDFGNGTTWGSPYDVMIPIFQYDHTAYPFLMFNTHSDEVRGQAWDRMMDCANDTTIENPSHMCGGITELLYSPSAGPLPFAGIGAPIFPAHNPQQVRIHQSEGLSFIMSLV